MTDTRSQVSNKVRIAKSDDSRHLVFGWAMVAVDKAGNTVIDHDDQWTTPADVEEAAYDFVLHASANGAISGEDHDSGYEPDAFLVESVAFTPEKLAAMGMAPDAVDLGHWIGVYIPDAEAYARVKSGEKAMLSVDGYALESEDEIMPPGNYVLASAAA